MSALNDSWKILISHRASLLTLCIKLINFQLKYRNSFLQIVASDLLKTWGFFGVRSIIQITIFSVIIIPFTWFVAGHDFSDFTTVPLAAGAYLSQEETVQPTNTKMITHFGAVQSVVCCCTCPALWHCTTGSNNLIPVNSCRKGVPVGMEHLSLTPGSQRRLSSSLKVSGKLWSYWDSQRGMCNICIQLLLFRCQRDGYWFDLGPFSPHPVLRALSYLGLDLQPTAAQAFQQWRKVSSALPAGCVMQEVWI